MARPDLHDAFLRDLQLHKAILFKVANAYCARREDRSDLIQDITIELFTAYPKFDARVDQEVEGGRITRETLLALRRHAHR